MLSCRVAVHSLLCERAATLRADGCGTERGGWTLNFISLALNLNSRSHGRLTANVFGHRRRRQQSLQTLHLQSWIRQSSQSCKRRQQTTGSVSCLLKKWLKMKAADTLCNFCPRPRRASIAVVLRVLAFLHVLRWKGDGPAKGRAQGEALCSAG